jgi:hypothetical protein
MSKDLLAGFLHPADAIVPCKICGAVEGVPCRSVAKDKDRLEPGFVHFSRQLRRVMLSAGGALRQREKFEAEAVKMLREYLAEQRR